MKRFRGVIAGLALALGVAASSPAHATSSARILLPCDHPAITRIANVEVQHHTGVCGWKVTGSSLSVVPDVKADLDIFFYASGGDVRGEPLGSFVSNSCVGESGSASGAAFAIVVLVPSACGANANANVSFTY